MRSAQRPPQLLDPLLMLGIGPRGCASPPKRSLGSRLHFVFPAVIKIGSDLVFAAGLSHVAALQDCPASVENGERVRPKVMAPSDISDNSESAVSKDAIFHWCV